MGRGAPASFASGGGACSGGGRARQARVERVPAQARQPQVGCDGTLRSPLRLWYGPRASVGRGSGGPSGSSAARASGHARPRAGVGPWAPAAPSAGARLPLGARRRRRTAPLKGEAAFGAALRPRFRALSSLPSLLPPRGGSLNWLPPLSARPFLAAAARCQKFAQFKSGPGHARHPALGYLRLPYRQLRLAGSEAGSRLLPGKGPRLRTASTCRATDLGGNLSILGAQKQEVETALVSLDGSISESKVSPLKKKKKKEKILLRCL